MSKRKRDPTFTSSEKEALLDSITKHFLIVESKKTDAESIRHKIKEWRKIATEYNAISGIYPRHWTVLKNCWENLKKKAKHQKSLRNQLETGGGSRKKGIEDPVTKRVLELIEARASGFVISLHLDGTQNLDIDNCESQPAVMINDPIATTSSDVITSNTMDWSQYTPNTLRKNRNLAFITSPSPDVQQQQQSSDSEECHTQSTPPRALTPNLALATTSSSRNGPAYKEQNTLNILNDKINTLSKDHAEEEHEVKIKILRLQEEKEKQILKQEMLKTKQEEIKLQMLELQLKKLKD